MTRTGRRYTDTAVDEAAVDGTLVTAPAWPAHPRWSAAFLQVLATKIVHASASGKQQQNDEEPVGGRSQAPTAPLTPGSRFLNPTGISATGHRPLTTNYW